MTSLSDIMTSLQAKSSIHTTTHIPTTSSQSKHSKITTSSQDHMTELSNYSISEYMKKPNFNSYIKNKLNQWISIHQNSTLLLVVEIKSLFGILEQENHCLRVVIIKKLLLMLNLFLKVQDILQPLLIIISKYSSQTLMK